MERVEFRQMKDGTREEYLFLDRLEEEFNQGLVDRLLRALRNLENSLSGYQVSRLEHSLQSAARAEADGADEDMIVGALLHDLGDELAPYNHSQLAATIIRPYVRGEVTWIIHHHGLFQKYYYAHYFGENPNERDRYLNHPWYQSCVDFCERYDQASFDPSYPTPSLEHFEPILRRVFSRTPFDSKVIGEEHPLEL
ncbi:HD domain-containing protein [Chromohalobacter canadensis]|uniref:HD domain-containing protein n=1 Tax=Chromohalobacter canadensis TaxID=141389 RepID=A0ABZ0Y8Y9_9GAMM|nr:HD domain-containing protein [Chromohalobacter canadensis]MCK0768526.1 HD domain-containing protein [Chromohalobacter canadensis]WQH08303.1 HD domain-containing protein [Chromohalobacter canadensis]